MCLNSCSASCLVIVLISGCAYHLNRHDLPVELDLSAISSHVCSGMFFHPTLLPYWNVITGTVHHPFCVWDVNIVNLHKQPLPHIYRKPYYRRGITSANG